MSHSEETFIAPNTKRSFGASAITGRRLSAGPVPGCSSSGRHDSMLLPDSNGKNPTFTLYRHFVSNDTTTPHSKEDSLMAELAESLKKLSATAPRLNQVTDAVNAAFRATEEYLDQTGIGIEERVFVSNLAERDENVELRNGDFDSAHVTETLHLSYSRINGKLRIGLEKWTTVDSSEGEREVLDEARPWDQAQRAWKLAAIVALPSLIEEIVTKAEKLISDAEKAQAAVAAVLADLSKLK